MTWVTWQQTAAIRSTMLSLSSSWSDVSRDELAHNKQHRTATINSTAPSLQTALHHHWLMSSLVTTPSHTWRTVTQQTTLHRHYKQHRTAPNHTATTNSTAPSIQTALHRHYKQHRTVTTNSTAPSLQTASHHHWLMSSLLTTPSHTTWWTVTQQTTLHHQNYLQYYDIMAWCCLLRDSSSRCVWRCGK